MTDRICWNGHRVTEMAAETCPHCQVTMASSKPAESRAGAAREAAAGRALSAPAKPAKPGLRGADRSWGWVIAGTVLTVLGIVVWAVVDGDGLNWLGMLLVALGQAATLVGVIGIGVFHALVDFEDRKQAMAAGKAE